MRRLTMVQCRMTVILITMMMTMKAMNLTVMNILGIIFKKMLLAFLVRLLSMFDVLDKLPAGLSAAPTLNYADAAYSTGIGRVRAVIPTGATVAPLEGFTKGALQASDMIKLAKTMDGIGAQAMCLT